MPYLKLAKIAQIFEASPNANEHGKTQYPQYLNRPSAATRILMKFEPMPPEYRTKKLLSATLDFRATRTFSGSNAYVSLCVAPYYFTNFDENEITWNTTPETESLWPQVGNSSTVYGLVFTNSRYSVPNGYRTAENAPQIAKQIIEGVTTLWVRNTGASDTDFFYINNAEVTDINLYVDTASEDIPGTIYAINKTEGYIDPRQVQTFAWDYQNATSDYCVGPYGQTSATFFWRLTGSSSWNSVAAGTTKSVAIAANTFPVGTIEWYVSGTDSGGTTSQTNVFSISTAAALSAAHPVSPATTIVNSDASLMFTWTVSNADAQTQTGADLQYSATGGVSWQSLGHATGDVRTFTVAPEALPGGLLQWRVRSYNVDQTAGAWSEAASFYYIAAPSAPVVSATQTPFATVTWTAYGQQAYEISVDGRSLGVLFGTEKNYTLSEFLLDGSHEISVRVQGVYSLWSEWGSVVVEIENTPGDAVTLEGTFDIDAALSWVTQSATSDFLIYRDGVQIGHATGDGFLDRLSLGPHSYKVVNRLSDGNYTASNIVSGSTAPESVAVSAFEGGGWIYLRLTEHSDSEQNFSGSRAYSLRHFTGADYPVCEISPYADLTATYDCAFLSEAEAAPLIALIGHRVIVKSRGGNVVIGPFTSVEKRHGDFYVSYRFSIQACHYEDYIDADD